MKLILYDPRVGSKITWLSVGKMFGLYGLLRIVYAKLFLADLNSKYEMKNIKELDLEKAISYCLKKLY